ncbi:MAG: flippase-like domain-containing protein [Acidobacteria bacterium]|nr:flippase-like domain-containing protein [Acidobacteriota bacterium]
MDNPGLDDTDVAGDEVGDDLLKAARGQSRARRVRSIIVRLVITVVALGLSGFLLVSVFDDLDWSLVWGTIQEVGDAERIALGLGAGVALAAQGLVTSSTVRGLPVRRGVLCYLAPASVASIVPGPSDLPMRYKMLATWGYSNADASLAVVASGIFSIGSKLILPVIAMLLALLVGIEVQDGFGITIVIAGVVLAFLIALTSGVVASPRLSGWIASWLEAPWRVAARLLRWESPPLAELVESARNKAVDLLRDRWKEATWASFLLILSQVGLMIMCLRFVGVEQTALSGLGVFVAYGLVAGLTVIPITAGSVGVAETAWIGLLSTMAGSEFINEITAGVLIYRMLTWLIVIPLGGISMLIWKYSQRSDD